MARPTGGAAVARARQHCAQALEKLGLVVTEYPFGYSAFVGSYGTPIGGLVALVVIGSAALTESQGHSSIALAILALSIPALAIGGGWLARRGVLVLPVMRRRGVNVAAQPRGEPARLWLVAHADSKSQPVPLFLRAAGIVLLGGAWLAALFVAGFAAAGARTVSWSWIVAAAALGAVPVLASVVGMRSAGAVDNASGVATVLAAASLLAPQAPIGVLITDAEELGLAGARAWCAATHVAPRVAVNCDGIDDVGELTLMWTRPRSRRLEGAVRKAAQREGARLRVIPLVAGVLVDAVALSDGGWEVVTLSRGNLGTLGRIHTAKDDGERLSGDGVDIAARVLARAATTLLLEER